MSNPSSLVPGEAPRERLVSLDAYRGLIMLSLLCGGIFRALEKVPGWHWLYAQNDHMAWEGCVYWDLIQPAFTFMAGMAMAFALARRREAGDSWGARFRHVLMRACHLTLIGILLDQVGQDRVQIGFIRVLQQIAISYILAFFVAEKSWRAQALTAALILTGWTLLWSFNPWNGPGGPWAMGNQNLGSAFDHWMLGRNYDGYYVGLNVIPSTATVLFGVMAGGLIRQSPSPARVMRILLLAGAGGILAGLAVSPWLPIIKRIWTSSFTLYAGGWTVLILALFYWLIEMRGFRRLAFPLVVVGMNSIAAYVIANCCGFWVKRLTGAWIGGLKDPLGEQGFKGLEQFVLAAFAWGVLYWFWKRRVFFKC